MPPETKINYRFSWQDSHVDGQHSASVDAGILTKKGGRILQLHSQHFFVVAVPGSGIVPFLNVLCPLPPVRVSQSCFQISNYSLASHAVVHAAFQRLPPHQQMLRAVHVGQMPKRLLLAANRSFHAFI